MTDEEKIVSLYKEMYTAMINKDRTVLGSTARLTGKSKVNARVFGGGEHTWRLQLSFELVKKDSEWYFTLAEASTY